MNGAINEVTPGRMPMIVFHDGCDYDTLDLVLGDCRFLIEVCMKDQRVLRGLPVCDGDYLVLKEWEQPTHHVLERVLLDDVQALVIL